MLRLLLLRLLLASSLLLCPPAAAQTTPDSIREFYRERNPEALATGQVDSLLAKYAGNEAKLLRKLQEEYDELERLQIAPKFRWFRGTVWRWRTQDGHERTATFGRDGRFLVGDPRCAGGTCSWRTTQATVQVSIAPELTYRLQPPAERKTTLSGAAKSDATEKVSATFLREGERGRVLELTTKSWDAAVARESRAVMVDFYSAQKLNNGRFWCGPCMALQPEFEKAAEQLFADGFPAAMARVDGANPENKRLLERFGVRSYPTLYVLLDGIAVDIFSEGHTAGALADYMRQYLSPPPNYYVTLGVAKDAAPAEIKKRYRELSRELHPDTAANGGDAEQFALVSSAYETLGDVDARSMYDAFGGIKFHRKGMQRNYMERKGIKLKLYQEEGGAVQTLTAASFARRDTSKVWVVDFYAPWCGHCQELRPEFHKVALALESKASFASVDCDTDGALCSQLGIRGYPQVRLIAAAKKIEEVYNGELKEGPIRGWVEDVIDSGLVELDEEGFAQQVEKGTGTWLIDFSAGAWCGPCTQLKSTVRKLSRSLAPSAKVGIVDCDMQRAFCEAQGITGYPAIKVCEVPPDNPSGTAVCSPLENNFNLQMGVILDLWAAGFAAGARAGGGAARAGGFDTSLGQDGFDFSRFEDNDEGSFENEHEEL